MARRIVVDVNDLVDTWRQKTNLLSDYFGDLDALTTSVDSDLVGAINSIRAQEKDSATISSMIDSSIGANTSAFFPLSADRYADSSIDSDKIMQNSLLTKHFTLASVDGTIIGPQAVLTTNLKDLSVTTAKIADLAVDAGKIANAVITSSKFNSVVTLNIYDSGGSIVKTLRTPGS
jgi:hypothetical protein|tara:strand:+ start:1440 stop:1967 length:528 start_codon:yes stop_codon:yes gene_type:complete